MVTTWRMFPILCVLLVCGCSSETDLGVDEGDQLGAEKAEVEEAREELDEAEARVAEETEDVAAARQQLEKEREELEEAGDAVGDAERQLEKEKGDLQAERNDVEPDPVEPAPVVVEE